MVVFTNSQNMCYFNTILQIFIHISNIPQHKIAYEKSQKNRDWNAIINKLNTLKLNVEFNPYLIFEYLNLKKKFKKGQQHDIHDVILDIIDKVHDYRFRGYTLQTIVTKDTPHQWSFKKDPFYSLELSIANSNLLTELLDNYFSSESISGWRDSENNIRDIIKGDDIIRFPRCLIIVLKQPIGSKIIIDYPSILDMTKYMANSSDKNIYKYNLNSVVIHKMNHYYLYCKEYNSKKSNYKWYLYNDEVRIHVHDIESNREPPYMLIYTKI